MRIWSIHPKYLDAKGLVALWREALLVRHVLEGNTKGYKNHPQLDRFRKTANPAAYINAYLASVFEESRKRGYQFNIEKILPAAGNEKLTVTVGQLRFEAEHLRRKLKCRDQERYRDFLSVKTPEPHPMFDVVDGKIEEWERITKVYIRNNAEKKPSN